MASFKLQLPRKRKRHSSKCNQCKQETRQGRKLENEPNFESTDEDVFAEAAQDQEQDTNSSGVAGPKKNRRAKAARASAETKAKGKGKGIRCCRRGDGEGSTAGQAQHVIRRGPSHPPSQFTRMPPLPLLPSSGCFAWRTSTYVNSDAPGLVPSALMFIPHLRLGPLPTPFITLSSYPICSAA